MARSCPRSMQGTWWFLQALFKSNFWSCEWNCLSGSLASIYLLVETSKAIWILCQVIVSPASSYHTTKPAVDWHAASSITFIYLFVYSLIIYLINTIYTKCWNKSERERHHIYFKHPEAVFYFPRKEGSACELHSSGQLRVGPYPDPRSLSVQLVRCQDFSVTMWPRSNCLRFIHTKKKEKHPFDSMFMKVWARFVWRYAQRGIFFAFPLLLFLCHIGNKFIIEKLLKMEKHKGKKDSYSLPIRYKCCEHFLFVIWSYSSF